MLASAHFWGGLVILALVILQILVRVAKPAATSRAFELAVQAMLTLFYFMLLAVPASGL
ncbi:hypothetical protein [Ensifer sp. ENS11]|uniref:hypothetical protein n=1 Tax=Ensifer sp. ENS11 TaxID=2769291 RepID=UPI001782A1EF|nr:hypothetical protein [Ensifer sp. ENS11]MBD9491527.1 hypothetical protein [Ensifer sp. ENS11]MDP9634609.1 cytochrome b561 [Ensifer adhaerens]